ncbi:DUF4124 domain-containing protein [Saccharophagus degradans]|uniref:DUF4124 domain-containing protein n=1 Tax=Saccharophagus degradans TaxID=86304 RepID=A0AAW7X298_9GAMM|nr:DUF4124 domain-containing protein [Saccharophagus degradans]MDO6421118.1 DUF4124 domain-containing protein [Saccharophagus degradans]MDO6605971.1 DUF4124 domain-containing protein [Saccharophagus degradans]
MVLLNGKKFILYVSTLLIITGVIGAVHSQGAIVKWVDENGKVHYGDRPPKDKKIQVETIQRDALELQEEAEAAAAAELEAEQVEEPEWDSEAEIARIKRDAGISQGGSGDSIETRDQCFAAFPPPPLKRTARGLRQAGSALSGGELDECLNNVCNYYDECG